VSGTDPRIRSGREPEVHPKVYDIRLAALAQERTDVGVVAAAGG
jgi:hypothetical protein